MISVDQIDLSGATKEQLQSLLRRVQQEIAGIEALETKDPVAIAELVVQGLAAQPEVSCGHMIGARNNYNARGRGDTMARRVLRGGKWAWLSSPASQGRYCAADRRDTEYGDVYAGDVLATYTLGQSRPVPDSWRLVCDTVKAADMVCDVAATKTKSGYRLTLPSGATVDVPDPAWR